MFGRLSAAATRLFPHSAPLVRRCSTREGPAGTKVGTKAFVESEMPAIVDLFSAFALPGQSERELDAGGLQKVLAAVGEHPSPETLHRMFVEADTDRSGTIDLAEFLAASDRILGRSPARTILVVGGPGSGKGVLCERLTRECATSHVSCGEMLREEVQRATPLGLQAGYTYYLQPSTYRPTDLRRTTYQPTNRLLPTVTTSTELGRRTTHHLLGGRPDAAGGACFVGDGRGAAAATHACLPWSTAANPNPNPNPNPNSTPTLILTLTLTLTLTPTPTLTLTLTLTPTPTLTRPTAAA